MLLKLTIFHIQAKTAIIYNTICAIKTAVDIFPCGVIEKFTIQFVLLKHQSCFRITLVQNDLQYNLCY